MRGGLLEPWGGTSSPAIPSALVLVWLAACPGSADQPAPEVAGAATALPAGAASTPDPDSARRERELRFWTLFRQARRVRQEGRASETAQLLSEALALNPTHLASLQMLGTLQFEGGRYSEALTTLGRLVEAHPGSAAGHGLLAALHACPLPGAPWDLDRARFHLERVLELNPEQTGPRERLGEVLLAAGDLDAAQARFDEVLGSNSQSPSALYLSGYIHYLQGRSREAAAALNQAWQASARLPAHPLGLGEGDTTIEAREGHLNRRLFARLWSSLSGRIPHEAGGEVVEQEYRLVDAYREGLPTVRR